MGKSMFITGAEANSSIKCNVKSLILRPGSQSEKQLVDEVCLYNL